MNDTKPTDAGGGDFFNYTNDSAIWSNDNGTALSEEERLLRLQLNSSFGAWLVFMEMSLGWGIYENYFETNYQRSHTLLTIVVTGVEIFCGVGKMH